MKLRRISEVDKMYRCCRWCHHYQEGKCWRKGIAFSDIESALLNAADMGEFSEVIEETMMYPNDPVCKVLQELKDLLKEWKVSSKRIEKFQEVFVETYEMYVQDMRTEIDEAILKKMNNIAADSSEEFQGIEIESPEDFVCKYFE